MGPSEPCQVGQPPVFKHCIQTQYNANMRKEDLNYNAPFGTSFPSVNCHTIQLVRDGAGAKKRAAGTHPTTPGGPSGGQRGNGAVPSPPPQPPPHLEGLGEGVVGPLRRTARNGTGGGTFARTWTTEKPSLRKNLSPLAAVTGDGPLGNPGDRSFRWLACQQIVAERAIEKRENSRSQSYTQFIPSVGRHVRFLSKIQHYFAVWVVSFPRKEYDPT